GNTVIWSISCILNCIRGMMEFNLRPKHPDVRRLNSIIPLIQFSMQDILHITVLPLGRIL
ncbi:MAG: hypothetical protein U9N86_08700, partial [Bacteroidota bacterium]|nr:hypothetical protein [Bacteroidota bacterium]